MELLIECTECPDVEHCEDVECTHECHVFDWEGCLDPDEDDDMPLLPLVPAVAIGLAVALALALGGLAAKGARLALRRPDVTGR